MNNTKYIGMDVHTLVDATHLLNTHCFFLSVNYLEQWGPKLKSSPTVYSYRGLLRAGARAIFRLNKEKGSYIYDSHRFYVDSQTSPLLST
jgi:hypothetical protein